MTFIALAFLNSEHLNAGQSSLFLLPSFSFNGNMWKKRTIKAHSLWCLNIPIKEASPKPVFWFVSLVIIRRLRSSRWVKEIGCIECRLTLRRMSRAVSDTDVEHLSHAYAGSVQGFTSLKSPDSWRATGRRKKPLPSLLSHSRRPMIICKKTMQSKQFLSHEDVCSQKSMLLFGDGSALWGWSTHSSSSAIIF